MAKYHINGKGEAGLCRARKSCPFGDLTEDHYSSAEEARQAFEDSMRAFEGTVAPASLSPEAFKALPPDTQRLVMAAVGRVLKEEEWDEQGKELWQAVYDSTEAGALWLERRRLEGKPGTNPDYVRRAAQLKALEELGDQLQLPDSLPPEPAVEFQAEFSSPEPLALPDSRSMKAEKTKLALMPG